MARGKNATPELTLRSLPADLLPCVWAFLPPWLRLRLGAVCRSWRASVFADKTLWQSIVIMNHRRPPDPEEGRLAPWFVFGEHITCRDSDGMLYGINGQWAGLHSDGLSPARFVLHGSLPLSASQLSLLPDPSWVQTLAIDSRAFEGEEAEWTGFMSELLQALKPMPQLRRLRLPLSDLPSDQSHQLALASWMRTLTGLEQLDLGGCGLPSSREDWVSAWRALPQAPLRRAEGQAPATRARLRKWDWLEDLPFLFPRLTAISRFASHGLTQEMAWSWPAAFRHRIEAIELRVGLRAWREADVADVGRAFPMLKRLRLQWSADSWGFTSHHTAAIVDALPRSCRSLYLQIGEWDTEVPMPSIADGEWASFGRLAPQLDELAVVLDGDTFWRVEQGEGHFESPSLLRAELSRLLPDANIVIFHTVEIHQFLQLDDPDQVVQHLDSLHRLFLPELPDPCFIMAAQRSELCGPLAGGKGPSQWMAALGEIRRRVERLAKRLRRQGLVVSEKRLATRHSDLNL